MSVDSHNSIIEKLEKGKAYSTKEIANLAGLQVNNIRQRLQKLVDKKILLKHTVKNVTYWAITPTP